MEAIPVEVRRIEPSLDLEADIRRAEVVAKLLDSQFEVAGLKFGLDALIGLVPLAGDAVSLAVGLYPVLLARKHRLGRVVIARMLLNLGVDFVAGAVPIVGDALDVFVKANLKNVALLKQASRARNPRSA